MGLEEAYGDINDVQSLKARMKVSSMWSEPYCTMKQQLIKTFVIHILHTINQELRPTFL